MTTDYSTNPDKKRQEGTEASEKQRAPEAKVIEKVIEGDAIVKKPGVGQKFKQVFFGGDFKHTMSYLAAEVLLPALRNLIVDAGTKGIERAVYGDTRPRPTSYSQAYRPRVTYNGINNPMRPADPRGSVYLPDQAPRPALTARKDMNDIILANRADAEHVVERMIDVINQFDYVTLADLYAMLDLPSQHTDNKWGWTQLNRVQINSVKEGFLVNLPPLEEIH